MQRVRLLALSALALALVAGAGCRLVRSASKASGGAAAKKTQLLAFVPCGLEGPFNDVAEAFNKANPQVEVLPHVENIDVLVNRVLAGEEADVFLSLGDVEVERMKKAGRLLEDTITPFALNSLGVIVSNGNPGRINTIQDFAKQSAGKFCFADPDQNSVGYYARLALQNAGVWDKAKDRAIVADQPSRVKMFVNDGRANAGVIYGPCSQETKQPGKQAYTFLGSVPQELYPQFPVVAAITKGGKNQEWGRKFIAFLQTDEGQSALQKWGFRPLAYGKLTGSQTPILIHSGAGLQPPMDQLAALFKKQTGVAVETSYKGSGCLLTDITFSHRGDLYFAGEQFYSDQCTAKGYAARTTVVARMEAVIIVQKGNPKNIQSLNDLARPEVKVGLGNPSGTAIGRVSEAILKQGGVAAAVDDNVKKAGMRALTVQEMANAVKLKALDAAIVWKPTARLVSDDADVVAIPDQYPKITDVPLAILKFSKNPEAAGKFLELALSPEGQKVFADNGYIPVAGG